MTVGLAVALVVAALGLAIGAIDSTAQRAPSIAAISAIGAPSRVLRLATGYEVLPGLLSVPALAIPASLFATWAVFKAVAQPVALPIARLLQIGFVSGVCVLLVVLALGPFVRSASSPAQLRSE